MGRSVKQAADSDACSDLLVTRELLVLTIATECRRLPLLKRMGCEMG
jgi:hypothetical protein